MTGMTDVLYRVIDPSGGEVEASRLPLDAMSLGRGVFETVLVVGGRVILLEEHARRLGASCEALGVSTGKDAVALLDHAVGLAGEVGCERVRMRVAVFGTVGDAPAALVAAGPAGCAGKAYRLTICGSRRGSDRAILAHKSVDYLENLLEHQKAEARGFDDALWLDERSMVAETTVANIFFWDGSRLVTPRLGSILPGVVRAWVLEEAERLAVATGEEALPFEPASRWSHCFITNSIIGLAPVVEIEGTQLSDPRETEWFVRLEASYQALLAADFVR